jgi:hypothetical protein
MGNLSLVGATSGSTTLVPQATGTYTVTLPAATGTLAVTASPTFTGVTTESTITSPAATALTIQSAGTTAMTIDTSQNVGIGVTPSSSTSKLLQMSGGSIFGSASDGMSVTSNAVYNSGWKYVAAGYATQYYQTSGQHIWYNAPSGSAGGAITLTQAMTLDASGNLLVGTTSQLNGSFTSKINVQAGSANGIIIEGSASSWSPVLFLNASASVIGNIGATQSIVSYNTSSDYRLKTNVAPMAAGLSTINSLKPVTYEWISDASAGEGFIAHELQETIPHAVTGVKDAVNEDGSIKPQGVDYSKIVVHLVAAIQEQQAQIEELKARLSKGGL